MLSRFSRIAIALFAIICFAHASYAQSAPPPTNSGTDFLLCFEQNDQAQRSPFDSAACYIYLANSGGDTVTVTITSKHYAAFKKQFVLVPGGSQSYRISDDCPDIWITSQDNATNNRAVHVVASHPIVCYGMNYVLNTCDAFMAIPKDASGSDYRIMSYTNSAYLPSPMPSEFAIAAFSDNTHVTIIPAANTLTDSASKSGHAAGIPFTVTLNAGECIQVQTDPTIVDAKNANSEDLTGSIVFSDSVVAVYGGHARTEIPFNYMRPSDLGTSRDVLAEQMPPTDSWGQRFALAPVEVDNAGSIRPEGDLMRVLALNDSTSVSINGAPWKILKANDFADSMFHGPMLVEASGPILVAEYAHTSTSPKGDNGDPFMAIIPSLDQTFNDYAFFISDNQVFAVQKVIIVADSNCIADITLDKQKLPASIFKSFLHTASGRAFANVELGMQPGFHHLSTTFPAKQGFTILGYGLGYVVSYGYTAGALLKPLHGLVVNQQLPSDRAKNQLSVRNITAETLTVDSVHFAPYNKSDENYGIAVSWSDGGQTLGVGQSKPAALHATTEPIATIHGRLNVYSHTASWSDLEPASVPFAYIPAGAASVSPQTANSTQVFPNPASNWVTVSGLAESSKYTITDDLGREVMHGTLRQDGQVNVSELADGVYFLHAGRGDVFQVVVAH